MSLRSLLALTFLPENCSERQRIELTALTFTGQLLALFIAVRILPSNEGSKTMAKCYRCGNETELHEAGVPICPVCLDERDRKGCPKKRIPPEEGDSIKTR